MTHDPRAQARVVLVDDGRQPEPRGRAHRAGDHQLALMTGNIGRPGTGANSITGQCNAMGSRLFSNTTNLLGGHDFAKPEHRAKVAGVLGIDEARIPREGQPGLRPDHGGDPGREDQGPLDRRHQPGALVDQPGRRAARCSGGSTSSSCRTCTRRPRPRARRTSCCPPPAGARRKARSSTPSAASACSRRSRARPGEALADFHIFRLHRRGLGLRRDVRALDDARRRCSQILKRAVARPALRHHRHRRLRA